MNGLRITLLLAASLVVSCSQIERVRLENATGAPIVVRLRIERPAGREGYDELAPLAPGRHIVFIGWRIRNDRLPVSVNGCTYVYRLSGAELWALNRHYAFPIRLEFRPDLTLDLPPHKGSGADPVPRGKMGFPRRATSRTCG